MKSNLTTLFCIIFSLLLLQCSSVKVMDRWTSENLDDFKNNNVLVIARTSNQQARIAFEQSIAKQLNSKGIKATESFKDLPNLNPDKQLTDEQKENLKAMLVNEGYNGVVLSVIKHQEQSTRTYQSGGYYAGATYPTYYGGFYGYYYNPYSYSTFGTYVPSTTTTETVRTFILETVAYDLNQSEGKQLAAVVTTKIEDPQNVTKNAEEYAEKIIKSLEKK